MSLKITHFLFVISKKSSTFAPEIKKQTLFTLNELKQKLLQFQSKLNINLNTKEL